MSRPLPRALEICRTPTPIQPLDRLSDALGGPRISVKRDDLTEAPLSGNKVRKLEFLFAEAVDQGADTVVTCGGIQSNHCRATALLAARVGLAPILVLRGAPPAGVPEGNLFLDAFVGARIVWVTPEEYRRAGEVYARLEAELRAEGRRPYFVPEGGSNALGSLGYVRAAGEIEKGRFTHLFHATGSGGTSAGLVLGKAVHALDLEVVGVAVCDDEAYFRAKIGRILEEARSRFGLEAPADIRIVDRYIGPGYAKTYPEMRRTMLEAARLEGLILDPSYTGKAFHGLVEEIRAGRLGKDDRVLFLHTGGIFGLLAAREQFAGEL